WFWMVIAGFNTGKAKMDGMRIRSGSSRIVIFLLLLPNQQEIIVISCYPGRRPGSLYEATGSLAPIIRPRRALHLVGRWYDACVQHQPASVLRIYSRKYSRDGIPLLVEHHQPD